MESLLHASVGEIFATCAEGAFAEGDAVIGVGYQAIDRSAEVGFRLNDFSNARVFASPCEG